MFFILKTGGNFGSAGWILWPPEGTEGEKISVSRMRAYLCPNKRKFKKKLNFNFFRSSGWRVYT